MFIGQWIEGEEIRRNQLRRNKTNIFSFFLMSLQSSYNRKVYKGLFLILIMEEEQLKKMTKRELIDLIMSYREKLDTNRECRELLRIGMRKY
jgi:hypothetical protein